MLSVNCSLCTAKCCKNYDVFIDHEDLKIQKDRSFIKKIEYKKSFGYVPSFFLWNENKKRKWVLCLSNPGGVCKFLINDRCSIYEKRPLICRTYPHYVEKDIIKTMKNLCPIKWKIEQKDIERIKADYEKLLVNFLAFETICDLWNMQVTPTNTLEDFLVFVENYKF